MYIDGVARETLKPWYDIEVGDFFHETYKLNPL